MPHTASNKFNTPKSKGRGRKPRSSEKGLRGFGGGSAAAMAIKDQQLAPARDAEAAAAPGIFVSGMRRVSAYVINTADSAMRLTKTAAAMTTPWATLGHYNTQESVYEADVVPLLILQLAYKTKTPGELPKNIDHYELEAYGDT